MMSIPVVILSERPMVRHYLYSLACEMKWLNCTLIEYFETINIDSLSITKVIDDIKIVLLDYQLPPQGGLAILHKLKKHNPHLPVLCFFEHLNTHNGVKAIKAGARGVIDLQQETKRIKDAMRTVRDGRRYVNEAIQYRLEDRDYEIFPHKYQELTPRQIDTLYLIALRKSNKEIGYILDLSLKTVERHKKDIAEKFGLESSRDIYGYALREGYFDEDRIQDWEEICI